MPCLRTILKFHQREKGVRHISRCIVASLIVLSIGKTTRPSSPTRYEPTHEAHNREAREGGAGRQRYGEDESELSAREYREREER
jgi:hypothetical protein